jgi:hypothetical protein
MKVGGTASITANTDYSWSYGVSLGTRNKWIPFSLSHTFCFLNHHYFKTFDELGVKAQNLLVL